MSVTVGGAIIHSEQPERLRDWYARAFAAGPDDQGPVADTGYAVQLGEHYFLFFPHEDVSGKAKEPARMIINFIVDDAPAVASRLDGLGVEWVRPLDRGGPGFIGTVADPDGNYVQIIQNVDGTDA